MYLWALDIILTHWILRRTLWGRHSYSSCFIDEENEAHGSIVADPRSCHLATKWGSGEQNPSSWAQSLPPATLLPCSAAFPSPLSLICRLHLSYVLVSFYICKSIWGQICVVCGWWLMSALTLYIWVSDTSKCLICVCWMSDYWQLREFQMWW